jgi:hypothetical protein
MTNPRDIRANAVAKLEAAQTEVRRWEEFLRTFDELSAAQPGTRTVTVDYQMNIDIAPPTRNKAEHTKSLTRRVLAERGTFVPTRELLSALLQMGDEIGGKDPTATLISRLTGATDIQNIRPHGWRLVPGQMNEVADEPKMQSSAASGSPPDTLFEGAKHDPVPHQAGSEHTNQ